MTNVRWVMIGLCFAGMAINYIDRANLSVAAHEIGRDLHLGPTTMGVVLGAFFWSYAVAQIPIGWLIDRFGPARVYPIAASWWSVFSAACGLGTGSATLTASRLLMGIGEASSLPTSAKVVALWFPTRERAFASCIWDAGARIGLFVAFPIVASLVGAYGWRVSFSAPARSASYLPPCGPRPIATRSVHGRTKPSLHTFARGARQMKTARSDRLRSASSFASARRGD